MKDHLREIFIMTLLIGCKLEGYLEISWIWVLSPIWVSILITTLVSIYAMILAEIEAKKGYISLSSKSKRIYWDAETQTMYGDYEDEGKANE